MQQGTPQDLMSVSSSSEDIKSFDPKPAIHQQLVSQQQKGKDTLYQYLAVDIQALQRENASASGASEMAVHKFHLFLE